MNKLITAAALAAALAACSQESPTTPENTSGAGQGADAQTSGQVPLSAEETEGPMTLSPTGLGGLEIGKPLPEGGDWQADENQISDSCITYHSDKYPESYAMGDGKVIRRITVGEGSKVKTARNIGPGSSEEDVRRAYRAVEEEPHKYVEAPAKYLTMMPPSGGAGLRFEIDKSGKVNLMHAGEMPWLGYVEGCA